MRWPVKLMLLRLPSSRVRLQRHVNSALHSIRAIELNDHGIL